jgi:hypothetical protein
MNLEEILGIFYSNIDNTKRTKIEKELFEKYGTLEKGLELLESNEKYTR